MRQLIEINNHEITLKHSFAKVSINRNRKTPEAQSLLYQACDWKSTGLNLGLKGQGGTHPELWTIVKGSRSTIAQVYWMDGTMI